jgi:hypothetical protein
VRDFRDHEQSLLLRDHTAADAIGAILYATQNGADILNNSWGGDGGDSFYRRTVQSWRAAGIFPAFSAGNTGPFCNSAESPGDYPESFSSGATEVFDGLAHLTTQVRL